MVGRLSFRLIEQRRCTNLTLVSSCLSTVLCVMSVDFCYEDSFDEFFSSLFNGDTCMSGSLFISDMVAPLIDPRTATSTGRGCPQTTHKLVPRKGINDAWHDEMSDILATYELTTITTEKLPPSLNDAGRQLPNECSNQHCAGCALRHRA